MEIPTIFISIAGTIILALIGTVWGLTLSRFTRNETSIEKKIDATSCDLKHEAVGIVTNEIYRRLDDNKEEHKRLFESVEKVLKKLDNLKGSMR